METQGGRHKKEGPVTKRKRKGFRPSAYPFRKFGVSFFSPYFHKEKLSPKLGIYVYIMGRKKKRISMEQDRNPAELPA